MNTKHDSFAGETGALAKRPKKTLGEELQLARWWLERLTKMMEAAAPPSPKVVLGTLNEFRDHLRRCYKLEEEHGLSDEEEVETPTLERQELRLLGNHQELAGRLEVLLNDLRNHPDEHPEESRESLRRFLEDCHSLDLEETHFVQRVAYAEYGVGD